MQMSSERFKSKRRFLRMHLSSNDATNSDEELWRVEGSKRAKLCSPQTEKSSPEQDIGKDRRQRRVVESRGLDSGICEGDYPQSQPSPKSETGSESCDEGLEISSDGGDSDDSSSNDKLPLSQVELLEMYNQCRTLYTARKITTENCFRLNLVDYMLEILNCDEFKENNLVVKLLVVEIGNRIYTCRVDHVHVATAKLAANMATMSQNRGSEEDDHLSDSQEIPGIRSSIRTINTRKRSRFIVDDESKINTGFEDQSIKYSHRRTSLKRLLFRNIDEEIDFDYLRFFNDFGETHPFETSAGANTLISGVEKIPFDPALNGITGIEATKWLPFAFVKDWDSEYYDLWGVPTNEEDSADDLTPMSIGRVSTVQPLPEFIHEPNRSRSSSYANNQMNDEPLSLDLGDEDFRSLHCDSEHQRLAHDAVRPNVGINEIRSLTDLDKIFEGLKNTQYLVKSKYGWIGPSFCLVNKKPPKNKNHQGGKIKFIDFRRIDFMDPANCYNIGTPEATQISDGIFERWMTGNRKLEVALNRNYQEDDDDYIDPFVALKPCGPLNFTNFFVDPLKPTNDLSSPISSQNSDGQSCPMQNGVSSSLTFAGNSVNHVHTITCRRNDDAELTELMDPTTVPDGVPFPAFDSERLPGFNFQGYFPAMFETTEAPSVDASEEDYVLPENRLRCTMTPRPVNMHALKTAISGYLQTHLLLSDEGKPLSDIEKSIGVKNLIRSLPERLDQRNCENLSLQLIMVALLHVVAEKRLFFLPNPSTARSDDPVIVCRGRDWIHADNIP